MTRSHRLLLPITALLACALGCAAVEHPAEPSADKPLDAADISKRVTFRMQRAEYEIQTEFDEDGVTRNTEAKLQLSLRAAWPTNVNLTGVTDIRITEAVLDSGESVVPRSINKERLNFNRFENNGMNGNRYGYVQIQLASPVTSFVAIKQVTGVIVVSAAGAPKEAELKPLSAFLGKSLALDGLGGAEITVERDKARGITITLPKDLEKRLAKVAFLDGAGAPIQVNGWGSGGGGNDDFKQTYNAQVPDDGTMTVSFYGDLTQVEVPFSVSDIPMAAKAQAKEKTKVTLKTTTPAPDKKTDKLKVTPEKTNF